LVDCSGGQFLDAIYDGDDVDQQKNQKKVLIFSEE
jgi:hypothetical protein